MRLAKAQSDTVVATRSDLDTTMKDRKIWFKGAIVPVGDARVSALSPTAQFGLNVFEGMRCYSDNCGSGQLFAFRLDDHLNRLLDSCKLLGIACPYGREQLRQYLTDTVWANDYHEDIGVRMTLFVDGEGSWSAEGPVEMFISPVRKRRTDVTSPPGLRACITSWERINDNSLPPRVKTGANYVNGRYAHLEAKRHGYDVPIFLGRSGKVTEGAGACLFVFRRGILATATLTSSVLESITRDTIIRLAADLGVKVAEREIDRTELYLADELFFCGSSAEITPITSLDGLPVGCGRPGEVTLALLQRYLNVVSNAVLDYSHWVVAIY
jgi:branched-chain amino acid aminotransferase